MHVSDTFYLCLFELHLKAYFGDQAKFDRLKSSWLTYTKESGFALHQVATNQGNDVRKNSSSRKSSATKKPRGMKLKPSRAVGPAPKRNASAYVRSPSGDESSDGGDVPLRRTPLDVRHSSSESSSSESELKTPPPKRFKK